MAEFLQQLLNGLSLGAIYALIALGYTMVYGVLRLINFANSEVFMLSAFGSFLAIDLLGIPDRLPGGGNPYKSGIELVGVLVVMFLVSVLVGGASAVALERIAYRPLRNAPRLVPLISAIGGGIGRLFGKPRMKNISEKPRGPKAATMSPTVRRSAGAPSASPSRTWEIRVVELLMTTQNRFRRFP